MAPRQPRWLGEAAPLITFVALGLPAGAIGVAWPPMRSSFSAPLAGLGLLLAAITIAYFIGSAWYGILDQRLGGATILIAGCVLGGLGMLAMAIAFQWWLIPILGLLVGAGSGLIDASLNTYVSLNRGLRYMGWLHASWAAGAALAPPLVVASVALTGSWRAAFAAAGAAFLVCAGLAVYQRPLWLRSRRAAVSAAPQRGRGSTTPRIALLTLPMLFLFGAGLEATTGDWSYTQLTIGRGLSSSVAGIGASLFWVGLAAGRVALGLFGHRFAATRLLDLSIGTCVVAALVFWLTPTLLATYLALPLLGLAISLIFPLLLSLTPARVGESMTGHTVGYGLAAGTLGGGAVPALSGLVLQGIGLWTLGPLLAGLSAVLLLVHGINGRAAQPKASLPASSGGQAS